MINPAAAETTATERPGYIDPHGLEELWFHTGTACNLACPFCLEGAQPGDRRLERITYDDARPYIDAALRLGAERFAFTGGEPFVVKDIVRILDYALGHRPCLVLTNGTEPLLKRIDQVRALAERPNPLSFRVSIDHPNRERHDAARGDGNFERAWEALSVLNGLGFEVSIARQAAVGEDSNQIESDYRALFEARGLASDTRIVSFPDFGRPGDSMAVPTISEDCMQRYHTAESRAGFMCAYTKMIVKQDGRMRIYACTLVDDDPSYDMGDDLASSLERRVMLHHHRCYSCFAQGASCS